MTRWTRNYDFETFALLVILPGTLAEGNANRVNKTLVDVKMEELIDKLAFTLSEAELKILRQNYGDEKG